MNFTEKMEYYETFYGCRISPSYAKRIDKPFGKMINTLKDDLRYYHKDAKNGEMKAAIMRALEVMHRLGAKSPNVYTEYPEIGTQAFKHADWYLQGLRRPLPKHVDEAEAAEAARRNHRKQIEQTRERHKPRGGGVIPKQVQVLLDKIRGHSVEEN